MASLEERIAVLEAREAFKELRARYAWHVVRAEFDAMSLLFAPDGFFEAPIGGGGRRKVVGPDEIHAMLIDTVKPQGVFPMIHNDIIIVEGDEAWGTCTMESARSPGAEVGFSGYYHDRIRRLDGRWLFTERRWFHYLPMFHDSGLGPDSAPK